MKREVLLRTPLLVEFLILQLRELCNVGFTYIICHRMQLSV